MLKIYSAILLFIALPALAQQNLDVEATTTGGQKVILHPDGRWDFADGPQPGSATATESKPAQPATATQSASQSCPPGSQGGLFGIGRCIPPGDKDYNRGTMNPSKR